MFSDEMRDLAKNTLKSDEERKALIKKYDKELDRAVNKYIDNALENIKENIKSSIAGNRVTTKGLFSKKKIVTTLWTVRGSWDIGVLNDIAGELRKNNEEFSTLSFTKKEINERRKQHSKYSDYSIAESIKKRCEQEGLKAQVKSIKGDYADYYYYDVNVTIEL